MNRDSKLVCHFGGPDFAHVKYSNHPFWGQILLLGNDVYIIKGLNMKLGSEIKQSLQCIPSAQVSLPFQQLRLHNPLMSTLRLTH